MHGLIKNWNLAWCIHNYVKHFIDNSLSCGQVETTTTSDSLFLRPHLHLRLQRHQLQQTHRHLHLLRPHHFFSEAGVGLSKKSPNRLLFPYCRVRVSSVVPIGRFSQFIISLMQSICSCKTPVSQSVEKLPVDFSRSSSLHFCVSSWMCSMLQSS